MPSTTEVDRSAPENESNMIDRMQKFVDTNHRVLQYTLYGLGGVGVFLIARNAYLFRTFNHVREIPERFIKSQVKLQGKVTGVGEDSILYIQHIPVLTQPKLPLVKPPPCHPLPVSLAFIEASPAGQQWLMENVQDKNVWFRLLHRLDDGRGPVLYSKVEIATKLINIQVNEELVRRGLCRVTALGGADKPASVIPSDRSLTQILDRLIAIETRATTKGVGMWLDEYFERKQKWRTRGITLVKTVVLSPFKGMSWLYKKIRREKI